MDLDEQKPDRNIIITRLKSTILLITQSNKRRLIKGYEIALHKLTEKKDHQSSGPTEFFPVFVQPGEKLLSESRYAFFLFLFK